MAEIHPNAAEYATVERLAEMLNELREPYQVTESYALFTTIVCWVMQRVRTPQHQNSFTDQRAREIAANLRRATIQQAPWQVRDQQGAPEDVFTFFKDLRDAVAHGDARSVQPINENGFLVGQRFECNPRNGRMWTAELRRADFQRLGRALAEHYCEAMRSASSPSQRLLESAHELEEAA